jgi:hypothetical protein
MIPRKLLLRSSDKKGHDSGGGLRWMSWHFEPQLMRCNLRRKERVVRRSDLAMLDHVLYCRVLQVIVRYLIDVRRFDLS